MPSPPPGRGGAWMRLPFAGAVTRLRASAALDRARRIFEAATDVATAVNEMGPSPSLRNYAAVGTVALGKLLDATRFEPWNDPQLEWPSLNPAFARSATRIFAEHPATRRITSGDSTFQVTPLADGFAVVFDVRDPAGWVATPRDMTPSEMRARLGRELWTILGTRLWATYTEDAGGGRVEIHAWKSPALHRSAQADAVLARARAFLDAGQPRAILLHGEPGVGKSSIVRVIADALARPTLVLEQREVAELPPSMLHDLMELLAPEVVVVDDFDRLGGAGTQIGFIDRIRATARLVLVTVNDRSSMDAAVTRAGRFDDEIAVASVREVEDVLPDVAPDLVSELRTWPIAFLDDLALRLRVLGHGSIDGEVAELRARVAAQRAAAEKAKKKKPSEEDDDGVPG